MTRLASLIALLVLLGGTANADEGVRASAAVDRRSITVGDQIVLTVTIETDANYQLVDPGVHRFVGDFEVLEALPASQTKLAAGLVRYAFRYRITSFRVGDPVLPSLEVAFLDPTRQPGITTTAELRIAVTSVIPPGEEPVDIKPLKPQLSLPGEVPTFTAYLPFGVALELVLVAALIARLRRVARARRRGLRFDEELPVTPAQRAVTELTRVANLNLPEKGRYREHYELLTRALRDYVAARFAITAQGHTARELRRELERAGVDRATAALFFEILHEGEVVRFHEFTSYPARAQHAVSTALEALRKAAVTEQYEARQAAAAR